MKRIILLIVLYLIEYIKLDAVCTEDTWINELKQDVAYNKKLNCERIPPPPPSDHTETDEERKRRLESAWDSDCSFEAGFDWFSKLKEKFGLKNGLVDADGKAIDGNFDNQADMCEIARALIAGGVIEGVTLDNLTEESFKDLSCPGNPGKIGICAVSGGSAAQSYAWNILLDGIGIKIGENPNWIMTKKSQEIVENRRFG